MPGTGTAGEPGFTFIHAADLDLDAPVIGVGRLPAGPFSAARDASLETFDALVRLAIDRHATFVLLAGSICDPGQRGIRAQERLRAGLERLGAHGIGTFIALRGAPRSGWPAIPAWPKGVTVFDAEAAGSVVVERDGFALAAIHGASEPAKEGGRRPVIRFTRTAPERLEIGMIPREAGDDAAGTPAWCRLDALRKARLDYWATAGRRHAVIAEGHAAEPWIVSPGAHQGRGLVPDDLGEKGAVVVTVRSGVIEPPEFVTLDRVRYVETVLDASHHRDRDDLVAGLSARAARLSEEYPGRGLVLRAIVEGTGPIQSLLRQPGASGQVLEALRDRASRLDPFAWWDDLVDATQPLHDRERIRPRADLPAEIVGLVDTLTSSRSARGSFLELSDAGLPVGRLAEWLPPDDDEAILREAEQVALDSLEEARA